MTDIAIHMLDGTKREFKHVPRPGGSYDLKIKYEGAFAVVVDEYYNETAIPVHLISEIKQTNDRW